MSSNTDLNVKPEWDVVTDGASQDLSVIKRILCLFHSPSQTFKAIEHKEKLRWVLMAYMILAIVMFIVSIPYSQMVLQNEYELKVKLGIEAINAAEMYKTAGSIFYILQGLFVSIVTIVASLIVSCFYLLSSRICGLKDINVKKIITSQLHVSCAVYLILIVSMMINSYVLKNGTDVLSFSMLIPTANQTSFIYMLMKSLSLTTFLSIGLLGFGLSKIAKVNITRGIIAVALVDIMAIIIMAFVAYMPYLAI